MKSKEINISDSIKGLIRYVQSRFHRHDGTVQQKSMIQTTLLWQVNLKPCPLKWREFLKILFQSCPHSSIWSTSTKSLCICKTPSIFSSIWQYEMAVSVSDICENTKVRLLDSNKTHLSEVLSNIDLIFQFRQVCLSFNNLHLVFSMHPWRGILSSDLTFSRPHDSTLHLLPWREKMSKYVYCNSNSFNIFLTQKILFLAYLYGNDLNVIIKQFDQYRPHDVHHKLLLFPARQGDVSFGKLRDCKCLLSRGDPANPSIACNYRGPSKAIQMAANTGLKCSKLTVIVSLKFIIIRTHLVIKGIWESFRRLANTKWYTVILNIHFGCLLNRKSTSRKAKKIQEKHVFVQFDLDINWSF